MIFIPLSLVMYLMVLFGLGGVIAGISEGEPIVVFAGLLLAAGGSVWIYFKHRTPPAKGGADPQPVAQIPAQGIIGTGGEFLHNRIPVPDRIRIGRDPRQCQLIFGKMAAGISSLHCEVVNRGGTMQLIDRGSKYGTIVRSNKLEANVPVDLRPGDDFYLGSKRNSFRVY